MNTYVYETNQSSLKLNFICQLSYPRMLLCQPSCRRVSSSQQQPIFLPAAFPSAFESLRKVVVETGWMQNWPLPVPCCHKGPVLWCSYVWHAVICSLIPVRKRKEFGRVKQVWGKENSQSGSYHLRFVFPQPPGAYTQKKRWGKKGRFSWFWVSI